MISLHLLPSGAKTPAAVAVFLALGLAAPAFGGTLPNNFQAGESASAAEVNANFEALAQAINTLEGELDTMTAEIADLEDQVAILESELDGQDDRVSDVEDSDLFDIENFLVDLEKYLEVHVMSPEDTAVAGPIVRVAGANLQIVNAAGDQNEPDGTGNLVVGFSEAREVGGEVCSDGRHDEESDCEGAGAAWAEAHNSGSHNIVGGEEAAYSDTGGLVLGSANATTRRFATILGGERNVARGLRATVLGGLHNEASGWRATASGGSNNVASGELATVNGGNWNEASDWWTTVSGGRDNEASASRSTVSGGRDNEASGQRSTISGGDGCTLTGFDDWGAQDGDGNPVGDC